MTKNISWWILWVGIILMITYAAGPYRTPLIFGFLLAYILEPLGEYGKKYGIPRSLTGLLILILVIIIFIAVFALITPRLGNEVGQFMVNLPRSIELLVQWISGQIVWLLLLLAEYIPDENARWLQELANQVQETAHVDSTSQGAFWRQILPLIIDQKEFKVNSINDVAEVVSALFATYGSALSKIFTTLRSGVVDVLNFLVAVGFTFATYFLIFVGWRGFAIRLKESIPQQAQGLFWKLLSACDEILSGYFRGIVIMILAMASYYSVVYIIIGIPYALVLGLLSGVLILLPLLGFIISLFLLLVVTIFPFSSWLILSLGVVALLIGQILENFVLTPRLVGQRIGLHPLVTIFAIVIFAQYWGIFGVLIAIPVTAVLSRWLLMLNEWLRT